MESGTERPSLSYDADTNKELAGLEEEGSSISAHCTIHCRDPQDHKEEGYRTLEYKTDHPKSFLLNLPHPHP